LVRRLLITIFIIMLLVVYYILGTGYIKQRQEHEVLTAQLIEATETLRGMPPPQDFGEQLAAAQAGLSAEQNAFPGKVNTTEAINTILELADKCELKAIPLVTQPWSIEKVGEHDYYVFRLNVAIEGSFSQLLSFISGLENGDYETLIIKNVSVTRLIEPAEAETEATIPVTASVDLTIYIQPLTTD
jgi:hypothetical protein